MNLHIITGPNGMCRCGENGDTCDQIIAREYQPIADRDKAIAEISELKMDANDRIEERDRALDAKERAVAELAYLCAENLRLKQHVIFQSDALKSPQDVYEVVRRDELDGLRKELERTQTKLQKRKSFSDKLAQQVIDEQSKSLIEYEQKLNGWFIERDNLRTQLAEALHAAEETREDKARIDELEKSLKLAINCLKEYADESQSGRMTCYWAKSNLPAISAAMSLTKPAIANLQNENEKK